MQKLILATVIICAGLLALSSCNDNSGGTSFKTKEDSINFAKSVMEIYPDSARPVARRTARSMAADSVSPEAMIPIPWDTVVRYSELYDADSRRLLDSKGAAYKGFSIDAGGYQMLLNNAAIESIYLRLGRKDDGSFTIMVMGMDKNGKLLESSAAEPPSGRSNFDNLKPCPDICP